MILKWVLLNLFWYPYERKIQQFGKWRAKNAEKRGKAEDL
jgi:hypothetical protein